MDASCLSCCYIYHGNRRVYNATKGANGTISRVIFFCLTFWVGWGVVWVFFFLGGGLGGCFFILFWVFCFLLVFFVIVGFGGYFGDGERFFLVLQIFYKIINFGV